MKCFFYKALISHALDYDQPVSEKVASHLSDCPSCHRFYLSGVSVASLLQNEAATSTTLPPFQDTFAEKVLAAIRQQDSASRPQRIRPFLPMWKATVVSSMALLLVTCLLFFQPAVPEIEQDGSLTAAVNDLSLLGQKMMDRYLPEEQEDLWLAYVADPINNEVDRLSDNADTLKKVFIDFLPIQTLLAGLKRRNERRASNTGNGFF